MYSADTNDNLIITVNYEKDSCLIKFSNSCILFEE